MGAAERQPVAMTLISKERAILFADVSGSTALYELLGDKPAAKAIEACLGELRGIVAKEEGQVVKTIGDEIMVVFGNGQAACNAAMEMQQRVIALPPTAGVKLAIRIGFHFGLVLEDKGDFWGDGVNTAARLAALAKAGQILTSGATVNALPAAQRAGIERRGVQYILIDESTNGTYVQIGADREVLLRRDRVMLRGRGKIAFGTSTAAAVELVLFDCS